VPESIDIRILIPDTSQPWAIPCRTGDLADDPGFRERAEQITRRHTDAITESVSELADLGLVKTAASQVRVHRVTPSSSSTSSTATRRSSASTRSPSTPSPCTARTCPCMT
jgi:hypothetical protein